MVTFTLGVLGFGLTTAFFFFTTFCAIALDVGLVAIPFRTTSDHNCGRVALAGEIFLPGVLCLPEVTVPVFLLALRVGVSPALLLMAAVNFGVASLPWMALIATAFLKSSGGDESSRFGVVVSLGFFALGGVAILPFGDFGLAFDGDLLRLGLFAGVLAAFGLLAGDFVALGLFAGDFVAFGLFAGDFVALGLLAGDSAAFGLLPGDFAFGLFCR